MATKINVILASQPHPYSHSVPLHGVLQWLELFWSLSPLLPQPMIAQNTMTPPLQSQERSLLHAADYAVLMRARSRCTPRWPTGSEAPPIATAL